MNNYLDLPICEIHKLLKDKKIKPIDLVMESLDKIEANKDLNCFITVDRENAIKRALELEEKEVDNILFGIPIAIKDNIVTKNLRTTAGSFMLNDFLPIYDAHVIDLINKKNMIIIGKTNMDEFACGSSNKTSYYGPVLNPIDKTLTPGGSSGGSACSVSSGLVPVSLGSDTGGSIRQPSAFCKVVGLKPTYGRISRYGLIAFSSSLDQIGPITRNVYENALILNALIEKDDRDLTNTYKAEDFTRLIGKDISGMKIAIPKFYISNLINKDILDRFMKVVELLKEKNVLIDIIDIPYINYAVPLYQIIALGELSSNLARFDGIKYGYASDDISLDSFYKKTRSMGFGEEVKRRIMIGSYLLSGKNAKEYYHKALVIRNNMSLEFSKVFEKYDLIIGPTTTDFPSKLSDEGNANKSFMDDILTIPVNMAGLPGMSFPIGIKDNLPIGMQVIAEKFEEAKIYQFASFVEKMLGSDFNE